ncbi:alpha-L-fucosidase [Flavihumibacter rivuli]|uniref:alpha-L-fucosidase n=1 Tax=Flavihumibacter rivuli TaxID=2838156 RepID=UPI001BDDD014|nr:alpha-L-fucosidase [Flavihumibacter rivuli]ULQ55319.1 alpha-L-fucosidase [Flavihumibacter rivuli]
MRHLFLVLFSSLCIAGYGQALEKVGPTPTSQQLAWHEQEFYLFLHFGPNTFTDKEWGDGDEPADSFQPSALDCRQWARIAKAAGAKGLIITAKHHDGFCLWPSQYSQHTVRESKWKNGQGDVLQELSTACREEGLKFGVYISPWDRNHPAYGTPEYNEVYINTMKEIFSKYGPIWELWWDGANGEGPNGKKQEYDFARFESTIRGISPNTVIFSDIGPDIRWVGNEQGFAGKTNWNLLDTAGFKRGHGAPVTDTLNQGNKFGKHWIPAEVDVSIRPGWFYHPEEDDKVKNPEKLFTIYLQSVGRGANLLLNVPPDRRGLIHPNDSAALMGFRQLREKTFANDILATDLTKYSWPTNGKTYSKTARKKGIYHVPAGGGNGLTVTLDKPATIQFIQLREWIEWGQKVGAFRLTLHLDNGQTHTIEGTTIGRKTIIPVLGLVVRSFTLDILDAKGNVVLKQPMAF